MSKNYMVVMLPNEGSTGTIEVTRPNIFEEFDQAFDRFSELVQESGLGAPARPRFAGPMDFEERDGSRIQLWVIQIPELVSY